MKNYFKLSSVQPGGSEFALCSELMSRVDELAPSDSSVSARISRLADGTYHTLIPIRSADRKFAGGQFYAEAKTRSLISSLKAAQAEMLMKLREWKSERF